MFADKCIQEHIKCIEEQLEEQLLETNKPKHKNPYRNAYKQYKEKKKYELELIDIWR